MARMSLTKSSKVVQIAITATSQYCNFFYFKFLFQCFADTLSNLGGSYQKVGPDICQADVNIRLAPLSFYSCQ